MGWLASAASYKARRNEEGGREGIQSNGRMCLNRAAGGRPAEISAGAPAPNSRLKTMFKYESNNIIVYDMHFFC